MRLIWGFTNWRLPSLQRAIRRGGLPAFQDLMALDTARFYGADPGTNYSQSRYLLYYLQERGLLRDYFRKLLEDRQRDPTGYQTLKAVLGVSDIAAFQREWEVYVLKLVYTRTALR